jgi:hypothetical protein
MVAAWPGMGNVAYGAANYLRESLKAVKFAEVVPDDIFYRTGVQIRDGIVGVPPLPKSEFFFHENFRNDRDLIIFIGESQPVMEKEYDLARRVVELAAELSVTELITFAATPVNISHKTEPGVWAVATDKAILQKLSSYSVKIMNAGHIGGLNGLMLGVGGETDIHGLCLLGEIPFYTAKIENPKSSLSILKVFTQYTGISMSLDGLAQMAQYVEEEIERVSKASKQEFDEEEAEADQEMPDEEEAVSEKGVSPEVRRRIEHLFEQAGEDLEKAGELKTELDRWNLFQEYEDRFLDLFKKGNR